MRLELVRGSVVAGPTATPLHSYAETALCTILGTHIDGRELGMLLSDVGVIFGPSDVRRPDLCYISRPRYRLIGRQAIEGPPDLCVEVLSPETILVDREEKFQQYAAGSVAHYWIADPDGCTLEAYRLFGSKYRLVGSGKQNQGVRLPPFPDLEIPLNTLWFPLPE